MEIWQFNDPEPLRPFLGALENHAPHLLGCARRLFGIDPGPNRTDIACLAQGLVSSSAKVRRAVRVLIFTPPVEEELAHFRRLLHWFPDWLPPKWYEQDSLRPLVAELICSLDSPEDCRPLATILRFGLKHRLRSWRQQSVIPSGSLELADPRQLLSIVNRRLPYRLGVGLKRRCLEKNTISLAHICEAFVASGRLPPMGSLRYWRQMKSLGDIASSSSLSPSRPATDQGSCPKPKGASRILSWGERGPEEIGFLEKLISHQANELAEVFRLGRKVSQRTKRVVLTLHNASLGAATGWGTPSFTQQIPRRFAATFFDQVNSLRLDYLTELSNSNSSVLSSGGDSLPENVENLFMLWAKRLIKPRLFNDLWTLRVSLVLNDLPVEQWEQFFDQTRELLDDNDHQRLTQGRRLAVVFAQPKTSRQRLQETVFWYQKKKESYHHFFSLLWALITTGEEWLQTERLPYLVFPIIDKFFISSKRDQDLAYLPLFVQLASCMNLAPLFLLIDDTSRAAHPSLELALEFWRQHQGFLGLGVFAGDSDSKISPLETILARSSLIDLFALRPLTQVHNPTSLNTLLASRDRDFLTPAKYDSSWKDNLPFLYHSTQVTPFSGEVKQPDEFYPAVITSTGPMAFGSYYRQTLRELALKRLGLSETEQEGGRELRPLDSLWLEYAELANLL